MIESTTDMFSEMNSVEAELKENENICLENCCRLELLLVPWTENHLGSFKCGFLNIFSRQNLLRSLSSVLFLLQWNKNGAKKCLKNHIPFDF